MMPSKIAEYVRVRAYFLSLERERSGLPSDPLADWCLAEREFGLAPERVERLMDRVAGFFTRHDAHVPIQCVEDCWSALFSFPSGGFAMSTR